MWNLPEISATLIYENSVGQSIYWKRDFYFIGVMKLTERVLMRASILDAEEVLTDQLEKRFVVEHQIIPKFHLFEVFL